MNGPSIGETPSASAIQAEPATPLLSPCVREKTTAPERAPSPRQHAFLGYGGAIASVVLAWAVIHLFSPQIGNHRSLLFFTAVVLSAMYGGLGPGLLATACAAVMLFLLTSPSVGMEVSGFDVIRIGTFLAVALMVSWMSGARRRAELDLREARAKLEARVEERTADLSVAVRKLEHEIEERSRGEKERSVYQARLRYLAAQLLSTEEAERRRLAVLLHDGIGQVLAVVQIKLESLPRRESDFPGALVELRELVGQAIAQTRSLTTDLSPPILYEAGLGAALEWLAARTHRLHELAVVVQIEDGALPVDEQTGALTFAAVRELIINVVKHARADRARICLSRRQNLLCLGVDDNGIGFDSSKLNARGADDGGFGLFNIRERLGYLGGTFMVESAPGKGTRARLEVPLAPAGGNSLSRSGSTAPHDPQ